jgi:hypothetical protein
VFSIYTEDYLSGLKKLVFRAEKEVLADGGSTSNSREFLYNCRSRAKKGFYFLRGGFYGIISYRRYRYRAYKNFG